MQGCRLAIRRSHLCERSAMVLIYPSSCKPSVARLRQDQEKERRKVTGIYILTIGVCVNVRRSVPVRTMPHTKKKITYIGSEKEVA